MRFFGLADKIISVDDIAGWLQTAFIDAELESEEEPQGGAWNSLTLALDDGTPVVEIERYSQQDDSLNEPLQDTVRLLLDDKNPVRPQSAVKWLCQFMSRVKVLYEFRPREAINTAEGWQIFNEVWTNLRTSLKGIVHLEHEGFTNLDGAQITWEYPDGESGDLKVAVLSEDGDHWIEYTLNLANQEHKRLFLAGKAPDIND